MLFASFSPILISILPAPADLLVLYVTTIFEIFEKETGDVAFAPVEFVVTCTPLFEKPAPSFPLVQLAVSSLQVAFQSLEVKT
ncbi:MAG: hypothetical protein J6U13_03380 [Salinivirgaceae bacterium]|nr:hypothetical protein [Salinivirgaceae bacterium]